VFRSLNSSRAHLLCWQHCTGQPLQNPAQVAARASPLPAWLGSSAPQQGIYVGTACLQEVLTASGFAEESELLHLFSGPHVAVLQVRISARCASQPRQACT
jgi:hypothetical protein